ncbi:MAG TPA: efflux RND transporter periplasmic adaptor subunit, partial [Thermoanaerobaculia bacterium]
MDIVREDFAKNRRRKRIILAVAGAAGILLISLGLSRLKPAAPSVDRSTVWVDVVKKGPMVRQVRGPGSLVPEAEGIRQIAANTDARVERLVVQAGTPVEPDTILLEMSNPEVERDALDASWQLKAAQADLANTKVRLQKDLMDQQAAAATVESDFHQAQLQVETNEALGKEGLIPDITLKLSKVKSEELATRNDIETKRLAVYSEAAQAQLAAQEARVEQLRALAQLKQSQKEALKVRAGIKGVLQELPLQSGQRVTAGTTLAKVVQPDRLKAQLKIAETQARDVQIGEIATIDTRNGIVTGRVSRVDPSVQAGTVTV